MNIASNKEIDVLTEGISPAFISTILKNSITVPMVRLYVLNDDETIKADISESLIDADLSITYQTGQRRSLNVTLLNINNKWIPQPVVGLIHRNDKFRFDTGFSYNGISYWVRQGVFLIKDISYSHENSKQTISFTMCDKFGLFDNSIAGKSSLKTYIPSGTKIEQAIRTILTTDKGNGTVYDSKSISFPDRYRNKKTFYDISQDYNETLGDILIEIAQTISCNIYYDVFGHMVIQPGIDDYATDVLPVVYSFNDNEKDIKSINIKEDWQKLRNKITVNGAYNNGKQYTATVENNLPSSPFSAINCYMELPEVIEDEKIYSDILCLDRAMYELIQYSRGAKSLFINCVYIPHLDVNQMVHIQCKSVNIDNDLYIIDNIQSNLFENTMQIELSSPKEVSFK